MQKIIINKDINDEIKLSALINFYNNYQNSIKVEILIDLLIKEKDFYVLFNFGIHCFNRY